MTCLLGRLGGLRPLEAALEALDPAPRVDELLLARVEGVAVRADLDVQLRLRRTGLELVPACAVNGREHVFGMDAGLHRPARIAAAVSAETLPPETTAVTAVAPFSGTFPARRAATATAPAGSHASLERASRKRKPASISCSLTSTDSTPRARQTAMQFSPAKGALRPSAIEFGWTVTGWPARRPSCSARDPSGSTATTRPCAPAAVRLPRPPPPPD